MPSAPNAHLTSHHRNTLSRILQHPVSHNIEWPDVLSLLMAIGTVEENREGHFFVSIGTEKETFEIPKHKDIDTQQVVNLRRLLKHSGYGSDDQDAVIKESDR